MRMPNEEESIVRQIIRRIQLINPVIGEYVASSKDFNTFGTSVKVDNGLFRITWEAIESYRRNPDSLTNADYESIARTFVPDQR